MPEDADIIDVEGQPTKLGSLADGLLNSLTQACVIRRTFKVLDREGVSVSVAQHVGTADAPITVSVSSSGREISWDLRRLDVNHPGRLQMLVESALLALDETDLKEFNDTHVGEHRAEPWPENELVCSSQHGEVRLLQPRVCAQWHSNACGYHALYNARVLLAAAESMAGGRMPSQSVREALRDEQAFYKDMFSTLQTLQNCSQEGSSWRPASLRSGGLHQSHMRHLLQEDSDIVDQRFFIIDADTGGAKQAETSVASLRSGREAKALAFLLGSVTHWVAAVATITPQGPVILLADSFNKPLLDGTSSQALAQVCIEKFYDAFSIRLKSDMPVYAGAPDDVLRSLYENGVPEWWKGKEKDSLYWKHRPSQLRRSLMEMEIDATRNHLQELESLLLS